MSQGNQMPTRDDAYNDPDVQKAIADFDDRMDRFRAAFERPSFLEFLGLSRRSSNRVAESRKSARRNQ
jgi:hypothetical protein